MAAVNPKALVDKLGSSCRRALEGAAGLCLSRTNYNVEIEHWLIKLLEPADTDAARILRHYDLDAGRVTRELTRSLDQLRTGNARAPELSLELMDLMREAWVTASLNYGASRIRSGYLLTALLADRGLSTRARSASAELARISAEQLQNDVPALIAGSIEDTPDPGERAAAPAAARPSGDSKTPALDQFTTDLTDRAGTGAIDPVIGRESEIRQVIDILTRRRQNNPILTGAAGVGKTAVVEGFALRVVAGEVPPALRGVALKALDLGLLQAGAGVKGEFENRLKAVIAEVQTSPRPIILFIDEAHTLIGAGGQTGQGDAANLLKPALARGELRTIAATTWSEYKKYIATDAALQRRFQVVKIDEPSVEQAVVMLTGVTALLEKHHRAPIREEAIEEAVRLSSRYITDRQLPDKAVSLLDTACARVALSQSALPPPLADVRREIENLNVAIGLLERETAEGISHEDQLPELLQRRDAAVKRQDELDKRWAQEKRLVAEIIQLRTALLVPAADRPTVGPAASPAPEETRRRREQLAALGRELSVLQGEAPLVHPVVDGQAVAEVVAEWTGVPVGKMVRNEIQTVLALKQKLQERVIGQDEALEVVSRRIQTARANLVDPRRPIGVFLLVGPSGVGKTETALALSDILYGGDRNMIVINMSEYKEDHKISRLTGSAPGYVGYGEGGVLTEAVRRRPYSVVLLDEIEKANVAVQEIFYQVFDKGTLQDDKGTEVNFKNTILLLTSNVGSDTIMKVTADPDTRPNAAGLAQALRPDLLKAFKPALLGRLDVVPYFPLTDEVIQKIIRLQLGRIGSRVREHYRADFGYDETVVDLLASRCKEVESGARAVDHILSGTLLPEVSREFLTYMAEGKRIERVQVGYESDQFIYRIT